MNDLRRILFWIVLILGIVAGVLLHQGNPDPVSVNLYFYAFQMPLSVLMLLCLALGFLLGWILQLPRQWLYAWQNQRLRRRIERVAEVVAPGQAASEDETGEPVRNSHTGT